MNRIFILKNQFTVLLILLLSFAASSQTYRCMVEVGDSWGYIDEKGEMAIPPKFRKAAPFSSDGFAVVAYDGGERFFIDASGNKLETEVKTFDIKGTGFHDGMAAVEVNGLWGFLNTEGKLAIKPKYKTISDWSGGFATAETKKNIMVITADGSEIIITDTRVYEAEGFSEGLAPFKTMDGKEGFINTEGKVVIMPVFKGTGPFIGGKAWVKTQAGSVGYINTNGDWIHKADFTNARNFDLKSKMALVKRSGQWEYINESGQTLPIYLDSYGEFSDGLAFGKLNALVGFIDPTGNWVIQPTFRAVRDFKNGYAAASKGELWGIIDETGNWVVPPKFTKIRDMEMIK
jgi:hypothetical protein